MEEDQSSKAAATDARKRSDQEAFEAVDAKLAVMREELRDAASLLRRLLLAGENHKAALGRQTQSIAAIDSRLMVVEQKLDTLLEG